MSCCRRSGIRMFSGTVVAVILVPRTKQQDRHLLEHDDRVAVEAVAIRAPPPTNSASARMPTGARRFIQHPLGHRSAFFSNPQAHAALKNFVETLVRAASDPKRAAFRTRSVAHYAADSVGHPDKVNRGADGVPRCARSLATVDYVDAPNSTSSLSSPDIVQAAGAFPPDASPVHWLPQRQLPPARRRGGLLACQFRTGVSPICGSRHWHAGYAVKSGCSCAHARAAKEGRDIRAVAERRRERLRRALPTRVQFEQHHKAEHESMVCVPRRLYRIVPKVAR